MPRASPRHLDEGEGAFELALEDGVLVAAGGAGALGDLALDELVELLEGDEAVPVGVGLALEALEDEVGEQAVAQLGQLERDLGGAGGGEDGAALGTRQALEDCRAPWW